jgi:hypothetical protein
MAHPVRLCLLALATAALSLAGTPGPVAAAATGCTDPVVSQPFLAFDDRDWYTLAPNGDFSDPTGGGWVLSGGASIVQAARHDGTTGGVLDLPGGSRAVSPVMCVTKDFPNARAWVRNVAGTQGVIFSVAYAGARTWTSPQVTGLMRADGTAWTPSDKIYLHPDAAAGWQQVRFTLVAQGKRSRVQVQDLWIDPKMRFTAPIG